VTSAGVVHSRWDAKKGALRAWLSTISMFCFWLCFSKGKKRLLGYNTVYCPEMFDLLVSERKRAVG
jgi:hypothetical protein